MNPIKTLVLCADDFGISHGVSRAIAELAAEGRLSATGAMTNMPAWRRTAAELVPAGESIAVGLHFNLTAGRPLAAGADTFLPLRTLLVRAARRRWSAAFRTEIRLQIDAFEEIAGRRPDFIDGHQHVHVLPAVRTALFEVLREKNYGAGLWLRDPFDRPAAILRRRVSAQKALFVAALAKGFRREARKNGFSTNRGFSGFSPLQPDTSPERVFAAALMSPGPAHMVMCHPGHADDELRGLDRVVEGRVEELRFLRSPRFDELLRLNGTRLARGAAEVLDVMTAQTGKPF